MEDNPVLNSTTEVKKSMIGFENLYEVSSSGYVSNYRKRMKTYLINSGYACLKLHKDGIRTSVLLHRVIAENFLDNPENKSDVNHKDGDKLNNNLDNLEWMTRAENIRHSIDNGMTVYNVPTLGIKKGKTSKYYNVTFCKGYYRATIRVNKKNMFSKSFKNENDAALHVNWIIDTLGLTDRPKNVVDKCRTTISKESTPKQVETVIDSN